MNLPNKLTVLRAILIPVFLFFMYAHFIPFHFTIALFVFIAASLTDALDGHIARKYNLVTDFGKFLDPLADKALVIAALAVFVEFGTMGAVPFFIIIAREFMVSGLRLVTADKGVVVAAGFWGKLKTAFTMAAIILILLVCSLSGDFDWFGFVPSIDFIFGVNCVMTASIWISVALTVISGLVYLKGYWKYIDSDK
ncbi:MAG: CDP-diacylglycerol--glycerol-3-phosphate 3-phosphatidyltransferase [Oscillospiraceae bacterium]|nr:CDP-diacylglycerol--glycerol-3-phosphate 3-phosphatidyltransferase [Oscillospiraceae bacterium]